MPPVNRIATPLRRPADLKEPVLDVVVLGARLEEQQALLREFSRHSDHPANAALANRLKENGYHGIPVFAMKDLSGSGEHGQLINVGLIECSEMGNVAAAINTAYAICEYRPTLVVFSGIAGALDSSNMRIGDVMLPRTIVTRDFNKLKSVDGSFDELGHDDKLEAITPLRAKLHTFQKTIDVSIEARSLLSQLPSDIVNDELRSEDIPAAWVETYGVPTRPPRVLDEEAAFSWNSVLSNEAYVKFLKAHINNAWTSVEMESYGFLRAVERVRHVFNTDGLVVRSISDFAQHKELTKPDRKWRQLALTNMAIATRCLIERAFSKVY